MRKWCLKMREKQFQFQNSKRNIINRIKMKILTMKIIKEASILSKELSKSFYLFKLNHLIYLIRKNLSSPTHHPLSYLLNLPKGYRGSSSRLPLFLYYPRYLLNILYNNHLYLNFLVFYISL